MPKATDEDIAATKAANPGTELHLVEHPTLPHDFIVRGPSRGEWNIYRQKVSSDVSEQVQADDVLFGSCVLWPPPGSERDTVVERYPSLVNVVAGELREIAGATRGAVHRKL